jgi:hypothetical protein
MRVTSANRRGYDNPKSTDSSVNAPSRSMSGFCENSGLSARGDSVTKMIKPRQSHAVSLTMPFKADVSRADALCCPMLAGQRCYVCRHEGIEQVLCRTGHHHSKRDKCIVMHSDDDGRHELRRRCVRSLPRNPVGKLREPDVMKRVADSNPATPTNYFNGLERIENWLSLALPTIGFPFRDPIASAAVLVWFGVVATADRSPASPTATPRNPAVSRSSWPARATSRTYAEECEASRLHLDPSSTAWLARFGLTGRRGHSIRQAPRGRQAQWCLP